MKKYTKNRKKCEKIIQGESRELGRDDCIQDG
jgi:hypothetical protein